MKTTFKAHPLMIWDFARPLLLVWLLPAAKSVIQQIITEDAQVEFVLEGVFVVGIFIFAFLKWKNYRVTVKCGVLFIKTGRWFKKEVFMDLSGVTDVKVKKEPLNLVFGGVTAIINTIAYNKSIKIRLGSKNGRNFTEAFVCDE